MKVRRMWSVSVLLVAITLLITGCVQPVGPNVDEVSITCSASGQVCVRVPDYYDIGDGTKMEFVAVEVWLQADGSWIPLGRQDGTRFYFQRPDTDSWRNAVTMYDEEENAQTKIYDVWFEGSEIKYIEVLPSYSSFFSRLTA